MALLRLYRRVPWFVKIPAKMVLSRLPLHRAAWRRLGLFRHGQMENVEYAYRVFRGHFDRSGIAAQDEPFEMLELGPGDSVLSAVFARAHGARRSVLVDVEACASRDVRVYRRASTLVRAEGLNPNFLEGVKSLDDVLDACRAEYHHHGLRSLADLPTASIDFVWSHAVLEHLRAAEFDETLWHLRRILKPDGIASHRVDLKDHLGGGLNNLRFSKERWESPLFVGSGFYTNRIRYGEMLRRFETAGFDLEVVHAYRWNELPTPRSVLNEPFRHLPAEDLCVSGFDVILRPRAGIHSHAA